MEDIGESIVVLSVNSQGLRDKSKLYDVLKIFDEIPTQYNMPARYAPSI